MNHEMEQKLTKVRDSYSFRPQQGLTIMNVFEENDTQEGNTFPSPTGVNHYEYKTLTLAVVEKDSVSVPNRG